MTSSSCFKCPFTVCDGKPFFESAPQVRHHIATDHPSDNKTSKEEQSSYRFLCPGCEKLLSRRCYFVHLNKQQIAVQPPYKRPCPDPPAPAEAEADVIALPPSTEELERLADERYADKTATIIEDDLLGMMGDHAMSVNAIVRSILVCSSLNKASVNHAENLIGRLLTLHLNEQPELLGRIMKDIPAAFDTIREPLKIVNSRYYFAKHFESLPSFIGASYMSFMGSKETHRFVGDDVYDPNAVTNTKPVNFEHCGVYYVPLGESLSRLFSACPELYGLLQRPTPNKPQIYNRSVDGANCRRNPLLTDPDITTAALCMTFDDVQMASKGMRKETVYQVSIMNLPSYYSTSPEGMLLLAQGNSKDFNAAYREPGEENKTTGTNIYLKYLTRELVHLETKGCNVIINGKNVTLYATLVAIVADNLAVHQVFSFAASFSKLNFPCVICKIHKTEIPKKFNEYEYRDEDDLDLWAEKAKQGYQKSMKDGRTMTSLSGMKGTCELRPLHWTIPQNRTIDVMHDIDYGLTQFGIISIIRFAERCQTVAFTIDKFNQRLIEAKFGRTDSSNAFNHINSALSNKNTSKIKFKADTNELRYDATAATGLRAAQGYTLLKLLDFLIPPSLIPRDHEVWKNLMRLRGIVLAAHSFSWAKRELDEWRYCYERTIQDIYELCETEYPLHRPKNHFGSHLDDAAIANGPPMAISCYAPERMLGKTTKQHDATGNHVVNLSATSVKCRQYKQAINIHREKPLKDRYRTTNTLKSADQCPSREAVQLLKHKVHSYHNWYWAPTFSLRGYQYLSKVYLCRREAVLHTTMPEIYRIDGVFIKSRCEENAWVLVRKMNVVSAISNRVWGGYVISENTDAVELMCIRDFRDFHPMDGYVHWAGVDNDMIVPGFKRVYLHSNSRWLIRQGPGNQF